MITILLNILFYLTAAALGVVCIYTAYNMSKKTCWCIKVCFKLILLGLVGLVLSIFYEWNKAISLLAVMPIFWGITGWLLFDKYMAHEQLGRIIDMIYEPFRKKNNEATN